MDFKKEIADMMAAVKKYQRLFDEDQFQNTPEQTQLTNIAQKLDELNAEPFPILINGKVGDDSERGDASYWDESIRDTIAEETGYEESEFMYVDGDQGLWPSTRVENGTEQGKKDAPKIYARLKKSAKDGVITENLQVVSHSRGSAFAKGYMDGLKEEIAKLAEKDDLDIGQCLVEYSVNLAPHQSNWIDYEDDCTKNVNISHRGDILSGNDATGNVINVHSLPEQPMGLGAQHKNANHNTELKNVLEVLENNENKDNLFNEVSQSFKDYDNSENKKTYPNSVVEEGRK